MKPVYTNIVLPSGAGLVRFNSSEDMFYFDVEENNPMGISIRRLNDEDRYSHEGKQRVKEYFKIRNILTPQKLKIIETAKKSLQFDKEFIELVYKAKSDKRNYQKNKFGGNLNIPRFASQQEKIFDRLTPGAKKITIDMAFQVGTFSGGDYNGGFASIIKTILMAQALGINLNIDVFDSDTTGYNNGCGYIICNVAKAEEKLDMRKVLVSSHEEFFNFSLFNGYTASGYPGYITSFLPQNNIIKDLGGMYDVIGGNMLQPGEEDEKSELIQKILKIGWKR